jgi:pimeloyl-ACP methyl ester carboxylesterase
MDASKSVFTAEDLRGLSRLGISAALGVTDLVEQMHHTILRTPLPYGAPIEGPARGLTGFVYRAVRGVMRLTGGTIDAALGLVPPPPAQPSSPGRDVALAVLNGIVGDRLATTRNPLALTMQLRVGGRALTLDRTALAEAIPKPTGRLLVLVHGLCMSDLQWTREAFDHGAALALQGFTPVYLFYNSGLHVSQNGRMFADILERLVAQWPVPVEDLTILGHSMGGLLARSACHYGAQAGHAWMKTLRTLVFLGTPHHGAPLERIGSWADMAIGKVPYTAAFTRLGKVRSAGVTDLRYGFLVDEDWQDRDRFERAGDTRRIVPLPEGVACYAVAATLATEPSGLRDKTIGDGLVQVASALGDHADTRLSLGIPGERRATVRGVGHLDLLSSPEVAAILARWLGRE